MTTVQTGRQAEQLAADYLEAHGFAMLGRNWRTRYCEIDIIARRENVVHIVEVKYRRSTQFGLASEYISHDKRFRLQRAAVAWTQAHCYTGSFQIDIVSVEGRLEQPTIELLENALAV